MPYRVEVAGQAHRDLDRIYRFIEADTSSAAATWFNGLHAALRSLSESPQRCPVIREDLALRHLLYGNKPHIYRAIFRIREERAEVVILTIRHGARSAYRPRTKR
jgi:plasmid stabilization system protein ParE